tara:strand:- start:1862 stop:3088 length:1227 start_codon:yes stop_codon:yes gene_type:complete
MYFNNFQYLKNKKIFILSFLILSSALIRIPIIIFYGDASLENEWKILVSNLILYNELSFRNLDGFLLPNLYMPPLYAYYLYFFSVFNLDEQSYIQLILYSQILLASISIPIFYKINTIFFSTKTSFYSSLLFSFFPLHVYACSQISSISLQVFLGILFFYFFFQIVDKKNILSIFIFSIISGLLILLRGEFILIFILSLAYFFFILKISIKKIILIFLVMLISISPYLIRNITIFNTVTITKTFGYNLWKGNNPNSKVEGSEIIEKNLKDKINSLNKNKYYQINLDKIFLDEAIHNILQDPRRYATLYVKKILSFLFIDTNSSQSNYYNPIHYLPVLLIGATSIIGILLTNKKSYKLNYLILIFFVYVFLFSCFFILPRYKLTILPLQLIFTNVLIEYINNKFFRKNE